MRAGCPSSFTSSALLAWAVARLWGAGWFVLPNPVYGSALKGGFDDLFPADRRWTAPREEPRVTGQAGG